MQVQNIPQYFRRQKQNKDFISYIATLTQYRLPSADVTHPFPASLDTCNETISACRAL